MQDRFALLSDLGVAACLVVRFNRSFARIQPQKFIKDILVKKLGVKAIFVGEDFRFGKDRSGDIALFQKLASQYGYEMHAVPALKQGGEDISSTRDPPIDGRREIKQAGRFWAGVCPFPEMWSRARARQEFGFPTANIAYEADILPPQGVYVVRRFCWAKKYPAIANIGTRPSFEKTNLNCIWKSISLIFQRIFMASI